MSGDLAGCMQRKAGADRKDLGFAGTYLEVWDFHTETSCVLEAAMDREGKSLLLGHLICSWCILGSWLHLRMTSCALNPFDSCHDHLD